VVSNVHENFSFGLCYCCGAVVYTCSTTSTDENGEPTVKATLSELLDEFREQKADLNSLRNEVRGNSVSVSKEVQKKDIKWKFPGNKIQFDFNRDMLDGVAQTLWTHENQKFDYFKDLLIGLDGN
jgi:hypothetical protein